MYDCICLQPLALIELDNSSKCTPQNYIYSFIQCIAYFIYKPTEPSHAKQFEGGVSSHIPSSFSVLYHTSDRISHIHVHLFLHNLYVYPKTPLTFIIIPNLRSTLLDSLTFPGKIHQTVFQNIIIRIHTNNIRHHRR